MTSYRMITAAAAAVAIIPVTIPAAHAASVGTVSGSTAAAQLRKGMPSTDNGAWARTTLGKLAVKKNGTTLGYSRALFPHWRDASTWGWPVAPNNACDSRNAALYRDGIGVKMSSTCTNLTGTWIDPYSAQKFNSASDIDIDHMVPLENAWVSGAKWWTPTKRTQYANDPLVLVSAWDRQNEAKGDRSPDQWKPKNTAAYCNYAERWVAVKSKYALSITTAEKATLTTMLKPCA